MPMVDGGADKLPVGPLGGNRVPESYLRKLYGSDHWMFKQRAPDDMPNALADFLREQL